MIDLQKIDGKIGVAVSGGMDSMALLNAYLAINQDIAVINIEHGIRGESSLRDSDFVRDFCKKHNIELLQFFVDVPNSLHAGESIETGARRIRYEIFDKLIFDGKVQKIALAHHADDNAETILMRVFRGTGIHGLSGIQERENYLRPLLKYSRNDIVEYVTKNNIPFVTDETNLTSDYTRNYIRNEIMPLVKTKYPSVIESITRLADNAKEVDEYLSSLVLPVENTEDGYIIKNLFGVPNIVQKYTIMDIVKKLGHLQDFETRHILSVLELKDKPNNTVINLPFNMLALKVNNDLIIEYANNEIFEETVFDINSSYVYGGYRYSFCKGNSIKVGSTFALDYLPQGAVIRTRKDGDVFKRVNGKTKLLSDFLNDKKLTKIQKDKLLVIAKENTVFAILGLETADSVKVQNLEKNIIIHIQRERIL